MRIGLLQGRIFDLVTEMRDLQKDIENVRRTGQVPGMAYNRRFDDVARRLDDVRQGYMNVFPSGETIADRLLESELDSAARAGCVKGLSRHGLPLPGGDSWENPLGEAIATAERAAQLLQIRKMQLR